MPKRKRASDRTRASTTTPDPRQQGVRAFRAGRYDTAIAIWSNLRRDDPSLGAALAEAHFRRALAQTGTPQLADLRRAVELAPGQLRYQYHLGRALYLAGDLPGAIERYRAVLQHDPAWRGAGIALALAVLEQDPRADIATLPGSTPKIRSALAPIQALVRGDMPRPEGDEPLDRLWQGLGLVQAGAGAARSVLDGGRALSSPRAMAVRRYYQGVADAQAGDMTSALAAWQDVYEQRLTTPWLLDNLVAVLLPRIREYLDAGDLDHAAATAQSAIPLAAGSTALGEVLVQTFDRVARAAATTGDWARAAGLWQQAREVVSASSGLGSPRPLLHNLALAYEAQEQWIEAAEAWRVMLRTRPRRSAAKGGEKGGASGGSDAQPSELGDVEWGWVRKRVIECYKRAGAPGEAVTVFRQAIKADPEDLDLRLQLVDALLLNEQDQAAYNELQRLLEIEPRHLAARLQLANLHAARHEWQAAETTLRGVLAEHPEREDVRRQMAQLMLARGLEQLEWGQLAAAAKAFEDGRQLAPNNYQFPLNLGRVAIDQRKPQRAKELLQEALELAADQPPAYTQVIECWIVADRIDEARAVLARAEAALPPSPDFLIDVGRLILQHKNRMALPNPFAPPIRQEKEADSPWTELATELLDRALALQPEDPRLRLRIAVELMPLRPEMALRFAEEGVRLLPDEPGGLMMLGLLLGVNDRKREAKETLRRGARLARQQGNPELAREMDVLREEIDSPLLKYGLSLGSIFDDLDDDDEFDW